MERRIDVGDRLRLSGGYDIRPEWLGGREHYPGVLTAFIPGQNEEPAAVVRLDTPITVDGVTGDTVVMETRYEGARWTEAGVVHLELCDFVPEPRRWQDRRQGKWIESHASYERVRST